MHHTADSIAALVSTVYDLPRPITPFTLSYRSLSNTIVGLHTPRGDYICKQYASAHPSTSIQYEHQLLVSLAAAPLSFAIPRPIPTRAGALLYEDHQFRLSLSPSLAGTWPQLKRPDHTEIYGAALGELHSVLRQYPAFPRPGQPVFQALFDFPPSTREPLTLTPQHLNLPDTAPYTKLLAWWREEARALADFARQTYPLLPHHMCHNDLKAANVLTDANRVVALLDFEFAAPTARALDFAQGIRMTTHTWGNLNLWPVFRAFAQGYKQWQPLSAQEIDLLPWLIRLRTALDVIWWLGHAWGRSANRVILHNMAYLRSVSQWLQCHQQQLVDEIATILLR